MAYVYADHKRASDPYALPDVELWQEETWECMECVSAFPESVILEANNGFECPDCGATDALIPRNRKAWFWWYCFPGCLPDSEARGPFATKRDAIKAMREECEEYDE